MMHSGNPTLRADTFSQFDAVDNNTTMTLQGTINKTAMMLVLCAISAGFMWWYAAQAATGLTDPQAQGAAILGVAAPWMIGGAIIGIIIAIVICFKPTAAPVGTPIYAIAEGLLVGGLSGYLNALFSGIVIQAVGLTFAVFAMMLFLYTSRIIKVTNKLKLGIIAATGGVFLFYIAAFIGSLLGFPAMASVLSFQNGSLISIGVSVLIVGIAAFNLLIDFDFIENGAAQGAPKYMEWYGAFALLVTLIWLYIEILRLLAKLRSR